MGGWLFGLPCDEKMRGRSVPLKERVKVAKGVGTLITGRTGGGKTEKND